MFRRILVCAASLNFLAAAALAQDVNVCIFQGNDRGHLAVIFASDPGALSAALYHSKLPGGGSIDSLPIHGVKPDAADEDAAALKYHCAYIVTLTREIIPTAPVGFAANIVSGTADLDDESVNPSAGQLTNEFPLYYVLRKTGSGKKLANGETTRSSPWKPLADTLLKKIAHDRK